MTNEEIISDTYWTAKAVYQVLGQIPTCVRAPYGDCDDRTRWVYKSMGLRCEWYLRIACYQNWHLTTLELFLNQHSDAVPVPSDIDVSSSL